MGVQGTAQPLAAEAASLIKRVSRCGLSISSSGSISFRIADLTRPRTPPRSCNRETDISGALFDMLSRTTTSTSTITIKN